MSKDPVAAWLSTTTVVAVMVKEIANAAAMTSRITQIAAERALVVEVTRVQGQGGDASVKIGGPSERKPRSVEGPKVIRLFAKPLPRQGACRICARSNILAHILANSASGFFRR